ncbi:uncharacterized protein LOC124151002 [Haliotis rufescens]|uniref:uncharacterized protein LOC124151002 n=1 Tax=Haliotis rufescens TaxID=6454 RepID=UPI00201F4BF2|nr:uncharacterized protein LOC124151002 [Haliotis rufescens]
MTMFDSLLIVALLATITPTLGTQRCDIEANGLNIKMNDILTIITLGQTNFQCVFNLTNDMCPCQDTSFANCFETRLEAANAELADLIEEFRVLTQDVAPVDCPGLQGCAALVASDESSLVAVADPVGSILHYIDASLNISALTAGSRSADESFKLYVISNDPFVVKCQSIPSGIDTVIANDTDLASSGGVGTGITFCDDGKLYVTIANAAPADDVILSIDPTDLNVTTVANVSCEAGIIRAYNGLLYYVNCKKIECINKTGEDLQTKFKFPVNINSFDVIDEERIVFCDSVGGLWIYNIGTGCYKLLDCSDEACADVKINRCTSFIYAVYPNDANLKIFNSTTSGAEGTLAYTTSDPAGSPRLGFEPLCLP